MILPSNHRLNESLTKLPTPTIFELSMTHVYSRSISDQPRGFSMNIFSKTTNSLEHQWKLESPENIQGL